jgi:hypothetical protein
VTAVNCTFALNSAAGGTGGAGGASGGVAGNPGQTGATGGSNGGGVANEGGPLIFTLKNSIVAYSTKPGGEGSGVITDAGNNISFSSYGASIPLTASTSFTNRDPYLGPLENNGGTTLTTAIIDPSSVAINGGDDAACLPTDQRHIARSRQCDIGAFELETVSLAIARQTNQVVLTWSTGYTGYLLQSSPSLPPISWTIVTNPVVVVGANFVVTNNADQASRFYRLNR